MVSGNVGLETCQMHLITLWMNSHRVSAPVVAGHDDSWAAPSMDLISHRLTIALTSYQMLALVAGCYSRRWASRLCEAGRS